MSVQAVTLNLPDEIYQRFKGVAEKTHQRLEDVVYQSLQSNLPPSTADLPPELQNELTSLLSLNNQALWTMAQTPLPPEQWKRHRTLLEKSQETTLSTREREELARLRTAVDYFVLRRSYLLAILKWRGYSLPQPENLVIN